MKIILGIVLGLLALEWRKQHSFPSHHGHRPQCRLPAPHHFEQDKQQITNPPSSSVGEWVTVGVQFLILPHTLPGTRFPIRPHTQSSFFISWLCLLKKNTVQTKDFRHIKLAIHIAATVASRCCLCMVTPRHTTETHGSFRSQIWQILSNHGSTRLKRFISWFSTKLCN
jgi:hypothetical protein